MSVCEIVPVSRITTSDRPLDSAVLELAAHLRAGQKLPPVRVTRQPGGLLHSEFDSHVVAAHRLAGLTEIRVRYGWPCDTHETDA